MANQLAGTKRRKSIAEHAAVFAALEAIADQTGVNVMTLMRQAVREIIQKHADNISNRKRLKSIVMRFAPMIPPECDNPVQLRRFKRQQREFDQVILDLKLENSKAIEEQNSMVLPSCKLRVVEFDS